MVEYLGFILLGKDQDTFIKRVLICIGQYQSICRISAIGCFAYISIVSFKIYNEH